MREATTKQIDNGAFHAHADEDEGYGYQFWPMRNGGFAHATAWAGSLLCACRINRSR